MSTSIKLKRGLKENLPILDNGELGYCIDTEECFIGTPNGNKLFNYTSDSQSLREQITFYIGPIEDSEDYTISFPTINQALDFISRYRPQYVEGVFPEVVLALTPNFVMEEQVLINGIDFSWVTITNTASNHLINITNIDEGEAEVQPKKQKAEIEILDNTISNFDNSYLLINSICFWFYTGENEAPQLDGIDAYFSIDISESSSNADIQIKLYTFLNEYSSSFTVFEEHGKIIIENNEKGEATWLGVGRFNEEELEIFSFNIVQQGVEGGFFTRIHAHEHGFKENDVVIIRDHQGEVEEVDYNGVYTIVNVNDNTFDLDGVPYYSQRAGEGNVGTVAGANPTIVSREHLTKQWEFFYYPAFGITRGVLPTIDCIFEMDESGDPQEITGTVYHSYLDGLCATDKGEINVRPYAGFINAHGTNIYGTRQSSINANDGIFDGAGRYGIWAYSSTNINARRCTANDCGWVARELGHPRFDHINEISGSGIVATRNSFINADSVEVRNCYTDGIHSEFGGKITTMNENVGGNTLGPRVGTRGGGIVTNNEETSPQIMGLDQPLLYSPVIANLINLIVQEIDTEVTGSNIIENLRKSYGKALEAYTINGQIITDEFIVIDEEIYRITAFDEGESVMQINQDIDVDLLVVGGGGSGAGTPGQHKGGGGGAGGLVFVPNFHVSPSIINIKVGKGGEAVGQNSEYSATRGLSGEDSLFGNYITAIGGGGGGQKDSSPQDGGSGGGGHYDDTDGGQGIQPNQSGFSGYPYGFGNDGASVGSSSNYGYGGGGAGTSGFNDDDSPSDGRVQKGKFAGGQGLYEVIINQTTYNFKDIFGEQYGHNVEGQIWFAGGGGGGENDPGHSYYGAGGYGGGGRGAYSPDDYIGTEWGTNTSAGEKGMKNTGGGGGGARQGISGAGGSGVVIVRYKIGG